MTELVDLIEYIDTLLDKDASSQYHDQPLAQDWARVSKAVEEAGEAVDALIGITGQNPRKGHYGTVEDLLDELADVALTGMYAIQHFTKDRSVLDRVLDRARYHRDRIQ